MTTFMSVMEGQLTAVSKVAQNLSPQDDSRVTVKCSSQWGGRRGGAGQRERESVLLTIFWPYVKLLGYNFLLLF